MVRFRPWYFLLAAGLLALEVGIACFAHDRFVRPYGGDFLATILLYCLLKSVWPAPAGRVVAVALLVSYALEVAQLAHLLRWLGWQHSPAARLVLGSQFAWGDMLAYTLGAAVVLGLAQAGSLQRRKLNAKQNGERAGKYLKNKR